MRVDSQPQLDDQCQTQAASIKYAVMHSCHFEDLSQSTVLFIGGFGNSNPQN